jgi:hypothetical protein
MAITIVTTPAATSTSYTDDGNTVYLERREPRRSGGNRSTVDTWGGSSDAIRELYLLLAQNNMVTDVSVSQVGASSTLSVTWGVDFLGNGTTPQDEGVDEAESENWECNPIEIPTALAAHPYFQEGYSPGSGEVIETGLAAADLAISNGERFVAEGAYKEFTSRYYALRMAGVEEWPQLGVEISRQFSTTDINVVAGIMDTVFQVVPFAAINAPVGFAGQIARLKTITDYGTELPNSAILTPASLEWLHRAPKVSLNRVDGQIDRYTITDTYWGIWKWSAVLYPGGSWDPQGETT